MMHLLHGHSVQETAWITGKPLGAEVERRPGFVHRVALAALRRERRREAAIAAEAAEALAAAQAAKRAAPGRAAAAREEPAVRGQGR
ncbi:hypothetical protein [Tepidiforma sp.]|uniref:hypothetical protein n=1 Tax=Tepidiforma sp. TaxID=2682230 RepID=UPI0021DC23B3|nr:hypothetical protein [Tepidiforma sp.]MCX7616388.1 hypothetical protein [Tepidiforma sp.]GIW19102.1 MAG: hypothetical protein KatS3mg064_2259 [Tepidiforma sp.]